MFSIVGFGLILSLLRYGNWLGLATSLIVFAVSANFIPIFQQLWGNVLLNDQITNYTQYSSYSPVYKFFIHLSEPSSSMLKISFIAYRLIFISTLSFLVMMIAIIGRITILQLLQQIVIYQILWTLSFYINIYICVVRIQQFSTDTISYPYIFDTFGTSYVYLFAAFYGLGFTFFLDKLTNKR